GEVTRQDDVIRMNWPIELPIIRHLLHGIEALDPRIPVLILLCPILGPEGVDNEPTVGDGVPHEQEPLHPWGLRCSVVIGERAKACVGTLTEHGSETEGRIYDKGREPTGSTLPELGEFGSPTESAIWRLDPVEH